MVVYLYVSIWAIWMSSIWYKEKQDKSQGNKTNGKTLWEFNYLWKKRNWDSLNCLFLSDSKYNLFEIWVSEVLLSSSKLLIHYQDHCQWKHYISFSFACYWKFWLWFFKTVCHWFCSWSFLPYLHIETTQKQCGK